MSVPSTFKAALLQKGETKHTLTDRSLPELSSGEAAIKITATAINPVDWKIRDYGLFIQEWPTVLGSDAAGEVVAVGPDTDKVAVGDRVFFQGIIGHINSSTFQQYAKMPQELLAKTPSNITDDQAAGISLATVAGVTGFYDKSGHGLPAPWDEGGDKVGKGKSIVILGGSSSVGQYTVQLARLSGFERIITNSSAAHHDHISDLGAHVVLDRSATPEDFVAATNGLPIEFVYDAISNAETQAQGVKILQASKTQNSRVITVMPVIESAQELSQQGDVKVSINNILGLGSSPALRYLSEPLMKNLGGEDGYIARGLYTPNRVTISEGGVAKLDEALELNKRGVSGQKVVIRPFDA